MLEKSPYLVRLRELPTRREYHLDPVFVRAAVATLPARHGLDPATADPKMGEADARVELSAESENVFVRGSLRGWVEVACSRCVSPMKFEVDEPLRVSYLPKQQIPEEVLDEDEELEVTEDDIDVYPYEGHEVDLEPLLREQLILAVPFAPLCSEECRGLCPGCGADRNRETCDCRTDPVDPRLLALKDFKF